MYANYVDLLKEFVKTDFKHRYKNSILGFLWMLIKPLALFSILYFVWNAFLKTGKQNSLFLLSGIMLVGYFNDGITLGLNSLINKAHIILKINFPREVVIFSSTSVSVINFLVNLLFIIIFALFSKVTFSPQGVLLIVLSVITLYVLILGFSFFLSIWNIVMRDIHHIVELALQMVFWATPVLYDHNALPYPFRQIVMLNPLTHILVSFRRGLLHASEVNFHDFYYLLIVFGISFLITIFGYAYFKKNVKRIAEFF